MNYIDWVDRVFAAGMARDDGGYGHFSCMDIAEELGFGRPEFDDFTPQKGIARLDGILDAVKDLEGSGIEMKGNLAQLRITGAARDVRQVGLRQALWAHAFAPVLDERAEQVLARLVACSEEQGDDYARLVDVPFADVWASVASADEDEYRSSIASITLLGDLREKDLVRSHGGGTNPSVWPTYLGVVRATRRDELEWLDRLAGLVEEWETRSVEFKRELDLSTADGKRRLIRSVLALATTKASAPRYLIIGYDPKTREFTTPVDAKLTPDRIEDVLAAYTDPVPEVRCRTVGLTLGEAGVIEVLRDPARVPYRVKKSLLDLAPQTVLVRHGTHVEPPTPEELADLIGEGERARGEPAHDAESASEP